MKRKIILPILLVAAVLGVVLASSGIGRNADAGNKHILVAFSPPPEIPSPLRRLPPRP